MTDMTLQNARERAGSIAEIESQRAVQEAQAAMVVARKFPRDVDESIIRIRQACKSVNLAKNARYSYKRGDEIVEGPSIELARVVAQNWRNLDFGIRELSNVNGESEVEAYCWDLETNVKERRVFHVKHWRDTRQGGYALTAQRDIYEVIANYGARRLRACIESVIPAYIFELAEQACIETLRLSDDRPMKKRVADMLGKFAEFGVKQEHIEKRLQHDIDSITDYELVRMQSVYKAIKDGIQAPHEFFDMIVTADDLRSKKATRKSGHSPSKDEQSKPSAPPKAEGIITDPAADETVESVIAKIQASKTLDDVDQWHDFGASLFHGEDRKAITQAANQRRAKLNQAKGDSFQLD